MSDYSEFDSVLSRYLDGTLSAEELAHLEAKLVGDDAFAEHVSRWCLTHRQVVELLTETKLHDLMDQFVQGSPGLPKGAFRQPANAAATESRQIDIDLAGGGGSDHHDAKWRFARWLTFTAAAAALVGFITWWVTHQSSLRTMESAEKAKTLTESPPAERDEIVATLTQVVDGVWAPGAPLLRHRQQLANGSRLALASGMAKVTYDCGAEVVLQGPCDFVLRDSMLGYLTAGRITAHVPRRAFSFAILSPQVDFVDLGTSFGVDVGVTGTRSEEH